MISSIAGRLIKKPELAERINIPGKRVVNFTVVENRTRGEKRLSVFFNLSMIVGTDAQYELVMRFDKGTVLLFSFPRITYVRQTEKSADEQSINIYAEVDNFKIVAGMDMGLAAAAGNPAPPPSEGADLTDLDDPFADSEPRRSERPPRPAPVPAPAAGQRRPPQSEGGVSKSRRAAPPPAEDLSDLSDPFADSEL